MVGGGGREHALTRKLLESPRVEKMYAAPGNGGISRIAECVNISPMDIDGIVEFSVSNGIDFVVVAPDDPLAAGMVDALEEKGIKAFGPNKAAAVLESSKVFSKNLMKKYNIPTASYEVFDDAGKALSYIKQHDKYPIVVKADGLALGKGVIIAQNLDEAAEALKTIMTDKVFGASGNNVVVEDFLTGHEASVLAFTDGKTIVPMVSAMDHKAVFDGDKGPNTGGMGTVSPNRFYDDETAKRCMDEIFLPTIRAMAAEGRPFKGCLFFGLMLCEDGPKVIEYNARFGDPETQVVIPRLKTDLMDIFEAVAGERLDEINIEWSDEACACVVMASGGYPGSYRKGLEISGLDENGQLDGAIIYHAGVSCKDGRFYTNGGRVLGVTALGKSIDEAIDNAYMYVSKISFDGAHYRKDIGRRDR